MKYSRKWFWLFVGPALFAFTMVVILPLLRGIGYSLTDWDGIRPSPNFVGFQNYVQALSGDSSFIKAFLFTVLFAVSSVISVNVISFGLALLVTRPFRGAVTLRSLFFMPNLIGGLILGFVWQFIFTKVFPAFGDFLHLPFLDGWLATPITGYLGLVIVFTWKLSGYMMVVYIAGIQAVPASVLEASLIDGANGWKKIRHVLLPMVAPAFTVGMFLSLSGAFKLYDENFSLTNGGPFESTQMMAMDIYRTAFEYSNFGIAQAKSVMFLLIVASITVIQMKINKNREVEL